MEHEGIFYFFEQGDGTNTIVLGDTPQAFQPGMQTSFNYAPEIGPGASGDWIGDWDTSQQLRTGSYRLWDWHLENASRFEATSSAAAVVAGNTAYKISDFAGNISR